jgi:hypothetical protein
LSILRNNARKSRVCEASPQSKVTGESQIARIVADVAEFLSARRPPGALSASSNPASSSSRTKGAAPEAATGVFDFIGSVLQDDKHLTL